MRKNMAKVIAAFEQGLAASGDSKRTCYTDGDRVYSYAMLIAERTADGIRIVEYASAPSATTRSQVRALEVSFPGATRFAARRPHVPPPAFRSVHGTSYYTS